MSSQSFKYEDVPEKYKNMGGRALTSQILLDEVPPKCDPLGAENKFIIAPGILAGTNAPSSGRLSVGGKSPLTGGSKEANAGGLTGHKLGKLGIQAVIFENKPKEKKWFNVVITKDKVEIVDAENYHGMGLYELIKKIWNDYPNKPGIMGTGIAGQKFLRAAGILKVAVRVPPAPDSHFTTLIPLIPLVP